jgi:Lrp/AsnC family transcriptional regulator of ectoine degradation
MKIDRLDLRILEELQRDGRMPKTRLADNVGLSPSPCWQRVQRLEKSGIVAGYHARVDARRLAPMTEVFVEISLKTHHGEDFERFENAVQDVPEIVTCHATGGGVDYLVHLAVRDVDHYQRLMDNLLEHDIGIDRYFGYIVTKTVKQSPELPLRTLLQPPSERSE